MDPKSLERSSRGAITGCLCWEFDGLLFPEERWSDFVVVVLGWWAKAWSMGVGLEVVFRFMDGPYWVKLKVPSGEVSSLVVMEAGRDSRLVARGSATREEITEQLIAALENTLGACGERGWESDDIDGLRERLDALRESARPPTNGGGALDAH